MNGPGFVRGAHRQSALAAVSEQDLDDQGCVDAVSADGDDAIWSARLTGEPQFRSAGSADGW